MSSGESTNVLAGESTFERNDRNSPDLGGD